LPDAFVADVMKPFVAEVLIPTLEEGINKKVMFRL
jgi:hypothetical protein